MQIVQLRGYVCSFYTTRKSPFVHNIQDYHRYRSALIRSVPMLGGIRNMVKETLLESCLAPSPSPHLQPLNAGGIVKMHFAKSTLTKMDSFLP